MRVAAAALLLCLTLWIPDAISEDLRPPEDEDASGDDLEMSGSGSGDGVLFESDTRVVLKFNATTPSAAPLETTHILITAPNPIPDVEFKEPSVSQSPSTTRGSTAATREATPVPVDGVEEPENFQPQVTSASPIAGDRDATPRSRKLSPKEGTAEPSATNITVTPAVVDVDVALKETPEDAKEKDHIPAAPTFPAPTTTTPSWGNEDIASSTLLSPTDNDNYGVGLGRKNETIIPDVMIKVEAESDSDIFLDPELQETQGGVAENQSLLDRKEVLAGVVAGGIVGLAFAIMLVSLMVYRMKKKDEGSYALDEQKHPNGGYQKPQRQEEFLA